MGFRLVPKSVTLNDFERRNGRSFCIISPKLETCVPTPNRFHAHSTDQHTLVRFYNVYTFRCFVQTNEDMIVRSSASGRTIV